MNFKTETIYLKSKELRELINESLHSSVFEDASLDKKLMELSQQIPFQIGMSLNANDFDDTRYHLKKVRKKLRELEIVVDLSASEYFNIDSQKLDSLVDEIREQFPIIHEKAEEAHQKWMDEIMEPFMVKNNDGEESSGT